ncbi:MAG: hypothetical protein R2778_00355 [Saprospiraceae bacterium]
MAAFAEQPKQPTAWSALQRFSFRLRQNVFGSFDAESDNSKKVSISTRYQLQFVFGAWNQPYQDRQKHGKTTISWITGYIGRFDFEYQPFAGPDVDEQSDILTTLRLF